MGKSFSCDKKAEKHEVRETSIKNKMSRRVSILQDEIVVAKLKVQKDRMESRIRKLDKEERQFRDKALSLAKSNRKDEAIYAIRQKKRCKEYKKKAYQRMDFIDR